MPCLLMRRFKNQNTMLQWSRRPAGSSETGDEGVGDVCRPVRLSVHFLLLSVCPVGDVQRAAAASAALNLIGWVAQQWAELQNTLRTRQSLNNRYTSTSSHIHEIRISCFHVQFRISVTSQAGKVKIIQNIQTPASTFRGFDLSITLKLKRGFCQAL